MLHHAQDAAVTSGDETVSGNSDPSTQSVKRKAKRKKRQRSAHSSLDPFLVSSLDGNLNAIDCNKVANETVVHHKQSCVLLTNSTVFMLSISPGDHGQRPHCMIQDTVLDLLVVTGASVSIVGRQAQGVLKQQDLYVLDKPIMIHTVSGIEKATLARRGTLHLGKILINKNPLGGAPCGCSLVLVVGAITTRNGRLLHH